MNWALGISSTNTIYFIPGGDGVKVQQAVSWQQLLGNVDFTVKELLKIAELI